MTEEEIRRIKRQTKLILAAVLLLLALLAAGACWLWYAFNGLPAFLRRDNPGLTPQAAAEQVEKGGQIQVGAGSYDTLSEDSGLGELLQADSWISTDSFRPEETALIFRFGELYELYLCPDGRAAFYDGYAPRNTQMWSYYTLPDGVVDDLLSNLPEAVQDPYGALTD